MITFKIYDKKRLEIKEYTLKSKDLTIKILNLGVTITSIVYNDSSDDVVLGYDTLAEYERFDNYFGATIGRCANRIAKGKFTLHEKSYNLTINDNENSLHGGPNGFHSKIFNAEIIGENIIRFHMLSPNGEEGYPGNLNLSIYVSLENNTLKIHYEAQSDMDTIINFTNHSYFALQKEGFGSVDHQLLISDASSFGVNDQNRLATGELRSVEGTPFDFQKGRVIGEYINKKENQQILFANGYDHYMRFNEAGNHQIVLYDEETQHKLIVETDLPGFHLFVPDYQPGNIGKKGKKYCGHCAVCLETSFMPDAINSQKKPETVLKKNTMFNSTTKYTFE